MRGKHASPDVKAAKLETQNANTRANSTLKKLSKSQAQNLQLKSLLQDALAVGESQRAYIEELESRIYEAGL